MAHMNQEKKARIAAALKLVIPKGWKYSLAVRNHSTIVLTISSAPVDILAELTGSLMNGYAKNLFRNLWAVSQRVCAAHNGLKLQHEREHVNLNVYYLDKAFDGELLATFKAINKALNLDNHDRSDSMTDYFDVGHYVEINVGAWNKAFAVRA
jgi:hypothetical protein